MLREPLRAACPVSGTLALSSGPRRDAGCNVMKVVREGPIRITKATVETAWKRRAKGRCLIIGNATCGGVALVVNPTRMIWRCNSRPRGTGPAAERRTGIAAAKRGRRMKRLVEDCAKARA